MFSRPASITLAAVLLLSVQALAAQGGSSADAADRHYAAQEWAQAAVEYRRLVDADETNARAWYRLGVSLRSAGDHEPAIDAFARFLALSPPQQAAASASFQGAASLARLDRTADAFAWLERAGALGFAQVPALDAETDLGALRDDARFSAIRQRVARNAAPCEHTPEHRRFDFWLGEWEVTTAGGQLAGTNAIQKIVNGCVIYENWTSASGGVGKSFNFYDPADGLWHQIWVDGQGAVLRLSGRFRDGVLDYSGESVDQSGNRVLQRLRFYDQGPGRVRQLWEQSSDGGQSWTVVFDGQYVRTAGGSP